ncbi:hypothetical protein [Flagellimonas myxillae]|uniref:hypothetical protein n=1 Tax=Flagellimonas myxillae TaxID=2942214 RepID=UPI00201EA5AF|nr:hypothetical protein [Muricauda myxillae]MCL6266197.1 hypothetical protein [Muricauda myxillae]
MKRISIFLYCLLICLSCSTSSTDSDTKGTTDDEVVDGSDDDGQSGNEEEEEEEETEIFTFSLQINGDYFNESYQGTLYLSNELGEVLVEKSLVNNSINLIELEVNTSAVHDITLVTKRDTQFNVETELTTFTDVDSGSYVLNAPAANGNGDTFNLNLTNTGFPLETQNSFVADVSGTSADGGSYQMEVTLPDYPGNFYGLFQSPDDTEPRYYYQSGVERNSEIEVDFQTLSLAENKMTVEIPVFTGSSVALNGFATDNGVRKVKSLDVVRRSFVNELYYPSDIFDTYELNIFMLCCSDRPLHYQISRFGLPNDQVFSLPAFEASLINEDTIAVALESMSDHDFNTVYFSRPISNIYDDTFNHRIHSVGQSSLSFSKAQLFDNIITDGPIQSSDITGFSVKLTRNSALADDYSQYIQAILESRQEYPNGTHIEAGTFFRSSFQ